MDQHTINGFDVREVRDWGGAIVLQHETIPAHEAAGYWTSKGKYVKPHWVPAVGFRSCQNWEKTCRAFARVYGFCVAVYCDDTVITFALCDNGRVKMSKREPAKIIWSKAA
jgi:hypothetical protein